MPPLRRRWRAAIFADIFRARRRRHALLDYVVSLLPFATRAIDMPERAAVDYATCRHDTPRRHYYALIKMLLILFAEAIIVASIFYACAYHYYRPCARYAMPFATILCRYCLLRHAARRLLRCYAITLRRYYAILR